jgi:mannosyltransferase
MSAPPGVSAPAPISQLRRTLGEALADRRLVFAIVIPTLVGLLVAGSNLGAKALWYDETFEALLVSFPPIRFAGWVATFEASGAFYHSLLWVWKFLGTSEVALRLPSVIFGVACIPVTFLIGRRFMSLGWAAIAAFLLAFSALWLSHAQEARPYALYLLMSLLSTLALIRAIEVPVRARWIVYAVVTVLAVWTHLMMVFVVLAQAVAMAVHPEARRWWRPAAVSVGLAAVAAMPIAISIMRANQARWYWIGPPTLEGLWAGIVHITNSSSLLLILLWLGLAAVGVAVGFRRWLVDRALAWPVFVVALIAVVPILAPWLASFIRPVYTPRYILPVLPALILLTTLGLSVVRPRVIAAGLAGVLVVTGGLGVQHWQTSPVYADWRTAMRTIIDDGTPSDGLAYFYRGPFDPGALYEYRYYLTQIPNSDDRPTLIRLQPSDAPLEQQIDTAVAGYDRLWLVGFGMSDPDKQRGLAEIERQYALDRDFDVYGLDLRLYIRRPV